jgi:uncharacterized protein
MSIGKERGPSRIALFAIIIFVLLDIFNVSSGVLLGVAADAESEQCRKDVALVMAWHDDFKSADPTVVPRLEAWVNGHPHDGAALLALALAHASNDFGAMNVPLSNQLLSRAVDTGLPSAVALMGQFLVHGYHDMPANAKLGLAMLKQAASAGDPHSYDYLGEIYQQGLGGVGVNNELAKESFIKSIDFGGRHCYERLAMLYYNDGSLVDQTQALKYMRLGADEGDPLANLVLASWYLHGTLVDKDSVLAFEYANKSASGGLAAGEMLLVTMYINGVGTQRNARQAEYWCEKAAIAGNVQAEAILAMGSLSGEMGFAVDVARGMKWLKIAARDRDSQSEYLLGILYLSGIGVDRDAVKGMQLLGDAARQGDARATLYVRLYNDNSKH